MLAALPLILSLAPEIARWLGGSQAATVATAVADAVKQVAGTDDPEAAAAALTADPAKAAELRVQLAKIAADAETAQRQADLESVKAEFAAEAVRLQADLKGFEARMADTVSARGMALDFTKAGSAMAWGSPVLSAIILLAFGIMVYVVVNRPIQDANMPLANVLLGTLAAMATQVANYWLGSSSGSLRKDALLQNAQDRLANTVPATMMPQPAAIVPAGRRASSFPSRAADDLG